MSSQSSQENGSEKDFESGSSSNGDESTQEEEEEERPSFGGPFTQLPVEVAPSEGRRREAAATFHAQEEAKKRLPPIQKVNALGTGFFLPQNTAKAFVKIDKDFAAFERGTKGIGSKLLMKMGYIPGQGLGKGGSGIVKPIDVKLRPSGAGLGMIDERTDAIKKEKGVLPPPLKATPSSDSRWKKAGIKKRAPVYRTAKQLIMESKDILPVTAAPVTSKIRDMRGEQEIVFNDISEMTFTSGASLEQLMPTRLPELTHNVRLISDLAKNDLLHISRQIRLEEVCFT
jgi:hypothetical protein